jgi:hypothetical protein
VKEIRLCWAEHVVHHEDRVKDGGLWTPATEDVRRDYLIIAEIGNATYGPWSHWVEEREA